MCWRGSLSPSCLPRRLPGSDDAEDNGKNRVDENGDDKSDSPSLLQISAFLEEHKAVGVPLYVVYGPGAPPAVLPPVLTGAIVEDALLRAAAR